MLRYCADTRDQKLLGGPLKCSLDHLVYLSINLMYVYVVGWEQVKWMAACYRVYR